MRTVPVKADTLADLMVILKSRGLSDEKLPSNGLIVYYHERPIACGFIRQIEGGEVAILGEVATIKDDTLPNKIKHTAITLLVKELAEIAKAKHIKSLITFTKLPSIAKVAKRLGFMTFDQLKHTMLFKPL